MFSYLCKIFISFSNDKYKIKMYKYVKIFI